MYRVLIADAQPTRACHLERDLADFGIKAISVISGEMAVAFSREYDLDLLILDLEMGDSQDALRLLRENELTSQIPIIGICEGELDLPVEGLWGLLDGSLQRIELARQLRNHLAQKWELLEGKFDVPSDFRNSSRKSIEVLLDLSSRILQLTAELKDSATEFGQDGPELFDFVEKSAKQMHRLLLEINSGDLEEQESQLQNREIRHDFRNILASVRGFTDLILMEQGIRENLVTGLKGICDCSNRFLDCLDAEKAALLAR